MEDLFQYQQKYDLLFVFGGSHPGNWETAFHAYQDGLADKILLTGGIKPNAIRHKEWKEGNTAESQVMKQQLLKFGVPRNALITEEQSTNSLENVLFSLEILDFEPIQDVLFVCKSFAAGRQYRTLRKHLPKQIHITPYPFDTSVKSDKIINRNNWMDDAVGRSFVYGEYLRILAYGQKGDIEPLEQAVLVSPENIKNSVDFDNTKKLTYKGRQLTGEEMDRSLYYLQFQFRLTKRDKRV